MRLQLLRIELAVAVAGLLFVLVHALDGALSGKPRRESAADLVLLAERPEDPQRAIVIVRSTHLDGGELTVDLELRNNSGETLVGHVWGQARLSATELVESHERLTFKAKVKTFKTLRFAMPKGFDGNWQGLEILVSDEQTGIATKYGESAPKPST